MDLEFKPGDRVRLTHSAATYYGGAGTAWVPEGQGGTNGVGTVLVAGDRPHDPRATPRPYYVRWDNGAENSYREEDLAAAPLASARKPEDAGEEDPGPAGNIIPFGRK